MSITAMKQALEALEDVDGIDTETECVTIDVGDAITALRTAIEQAETAQGQEPVAWIYQNSNTDDKYLVWSKQTGGRNWQPLYTHPQPQRQSLTEEQIMDAWDEAVKYAPSEIRIKDFARAIEAAHGIKENT